MPLSTMMSSNVNSTCYGGYVEHRFVIYYQVAMFALSNMLAYKLRDYDSRIPSRLVTVLTIIRRCIVECVNLTTSMHTVTFFLTELICRFPPTLGTVILHVILFFIFTALGLIISMFIIKQILIKEPAHIENFLPGQLARIVIGVIATLSLTTMGGSCLDCVLNDKVIFREVALWADVPLTGGWVNVPLITVVVILCLGLLGVGYDLCVNRSRNIIKLSTLSTWIGLIVFSSTLAIYEQYFVEGESYPIIGLLGPICFNYLLIGFTETAMLKDQEYQEEEKRLRELMALPAGPSRV